MAVKMISARIEGELVSMAEGHTILDAAREYGRAIPTLCHMKGLKPAGACRLCMVELAGSQRMVPACTTPLQEGMSIRTNSPNLSLYRKLVIELLLSERNHVCSVCVSNGLCELQELARSFGVTHVRYPLDQPPLDVDMTHSRFVFDQNRCVLCTRCVRVCSEVEGAGVWEVAGRGIASRLVNELAGEWSEADSCTGCGKCVQVCPTGALSEKGRLPREAYKNRSMLEALCQRKTMLEPG